MDDGGTLKEWSVYSSLRTLSKVVLDAESIWHWNFRARFRWQNLLTIEPAWAAAADLATWGCEPPAPADSECLRVVGCECRRANEPNDRAHPNSMRILWEGEGVLDGLDSRKKGKDNGQIQWRAVRTLYYAGITGGERAFHGGLCVVSRCSLGLFAARISGTALLQ